MNKLINWCCSLTIIVALSSCIGEKNVDVHVYPIPQQMELAGKWITLPTEGFQLKGNGELDVDAVEVLRNNLPITEQGGKEILVKQLDQSDPKMQRSGAYTLDVSEEGIQIEIYDNRSLFYAAQTLQQLLAQEGKKLPVCSIKDYPDVVFRGVVEGFYGIPWSFENRVEQLRFYGRMKMNTYIFGPKDDPYHRSPYWREPYPEDQAQNIRQLLAEAQKNKVDFVWAMHPGMDIRWNEADRIAAIKKLESMYDLGVRAFAVFFDDIEGEGTDATKQAAFMNYLKSEFVDKKGDIQQLILCPTEYNKDWAKTDYLDILGDHLDPFIHIMWTGDKVVSDITHEGLEWVNKRIKRPCYVWWNFPVSDYCLAHLLMGPVYGLDNNAVSDMHAFVSNPMEFAEASKVALWSVSQFTWNMAKFEPEQSWSLACESLVPEAPEAFRIFCEHNADIGPNTWMYYRQESFRSADLIRQFEQSLLGGTYLPKEAKEITALFEQIEKAPGEVQEKSANRELIREIQPWLTQTRNVAMAGKATMKMIEAANKKDKEACRTAYKEVKKALETIADFSRPYRRGEQDGVRSGSQVLLPFIQNMLVHVENTLLPEEQPKERPEVLAGSKAFEELACYTEDDVVGLVPHFPLVTIAPGEYFGFKMEDSKQPISLVYDLRKSKAKGRALQGSIDGKVWFTFPKEAANRIDTIPIHDTRVRYIRCLNQSNADMSIGIGRFAVLTERNK
ncbi:MAG: beta-N-acetylglucosaminidase domain-containing protein [Parabacteroides sp.]|nr:beta-N-acetylglucosaminidase domain-containing protein [Parabacteroides sp.]